jgi:hypothetical protein
VARGVSDDLKHEVTVAGEWHAVPG